MSENKEHEWTRDELLALTRSDDPVTRGLEKEKKHKITVEPYFKARDFNRQGSDDFEDNPPHVGYEVGLKFTF